MMYPIEIVWIILLQDSNIPINGWRNDIAFLITLSDIALT